MSNGVYNTIKLYKTELWEFIILLNCIMSKKS